MDSVTIATGENDISKSDTRPKWMQVVPKLLTKHARALNASWDRTVMINIEEICRIIERDMESSVLNKSFFYNKYYSIF